jgi:antitoxin HicB
MTKNPHRGSNFDDFLAEEGLLEEVTLLATKKVLSLQIADAMKMQGLTKTALAAQMGTTRAQLDRLLDPDNDSVTLATLKRAAKALGKTLRLELA